MLDIRQQVDISVFRWQVFNHPSVLSADAVPQYEMLSDGPEKEYIRSDIVELRQRVRYVNFTCHRFIMCFHINERNGNCRSSRRLIQNMHDIYRLWTHCD